MSPLWRFNGRTKPAHVAGVESEYGAALAWGATADGDPVVATLSSLVILAAAPLELPWHLIDKAAWNPPAFDLRYRPVMGGAPRTLRLELGEPGKLPPVVRERVTKSVVISRRVAIEGDLGAVLAARRDAAGAVSWTVTFDLGLDPGDPALQQRARQALAELRQSYGA